jgi:hypothetical protein
VRPPRPSSSSSGSDAVIRAVARPDDPVESVLLRVQDRVGFVELFGAALRRDGSTKGSSNPKAASKLKGVGALRKMPAGKAAVVGTFLPGDKVMAQNLRRGWRRPTAGARVFASEVVGAAEPVSPKVSCFGAVQSERCALAPPEEEECGGCWASVTAVVRGLCWSDAPREGEPEASGSSSTATPESPPNAVLSPPQPVTGG